jgi:hypothetical protein
VPQQVFPIKCLNDASNNSQERVNKSNYSKTERPTSKSSRRITASVKTFASIMFDDFLKHTYILYNWKKIHQSNQKNAQTCDPSPATCWWFAETVTECMTYKAEGHRG